MSVKPARVLGVVSVAGLATWALILGVTTLSQSGCPGSGSSGADMGGGMSRDLAFTSCCGKVGDTGNSKGVGQFCIEHTDCPSGTKEASLCSFAAAAQKRAYFCTFPCNPDMGATVCGEGAVCQFDTAFQAYGCVPSACLANLPAGCSL
ncbi:MAG: hypothetical protein JNJ46_17540 [Myxococcales bacterium]|nr:hypothetical protein [Myxococcales bacterium]